MIRIILYLLLFYVLFLYSAEMASGQMNSIEILNQKVEKISENENENESKLPATFEVRSKAKCRAKIHKIEEVIEQDTALIKCLKATKHQR